MSEWRASGPELEGGELVVSARRRALAVLHKCSPGRSDEKECKAVVRFRDVFAGGLVLRRLDGSSIQMFLELRRPPRVFCRPSESSRPPPVRYATKATKTSTKA